MHPTDQPQPRRRCSTFGIGRGTEHIHTSEGPRVTSVDRGGQTGARLEIRVSHGLVSTWPLRRLVAHQIRHHLKPIGGAVGDQRGQGRRRKLQQVTKSATPSSPLPASSCCSPRFLPLSSLLFDTWCPSRVIWATKRPSTPQLPHQLTNVQQGEGSHENETQNIGNVHRGTESEGMRRNLRKLEIHICCQFCRVVPSLLSRSS